jgi:transposase, IS5 family
MVGAVCADRAGLSEAGQWPPASWGRADAAPLFLAAMVQPIGPGGEGGALRFAGDAAFCRHRPPPSRGQALGREPVPDETTVCRFRHLLELGRQLFDEVQRHPAAKGLKMTTGTIVDAMIINAPSSTKNADKTRDPEMHQTKKENQWYFGMKAHFGVDSRTKLIHAVVASPANVADSTVLPRPLHGNETRVWGDQAYRGQRAVIRQRAPRAQDFVNRRGRHRGVVDEVERVKTGPKSKVRAKVEHPIGVIK